MADVDQLSEGPAIEVLMGSNELNRKTNPFIEKIASTVLDEIIQADVSMRQRQLDVWKSLVSYNGAKSLIAGHLYNNLAIDQCLTLDRLELSFHVKPVTDDTFF